MKKISILISGGIGIVAMFGTWIFLSKVKKETIHNANRTLDCCIEKMDDIEKRVEYFYNNNLFKDENEKALFDNTIKNEMLDLMNLIIEGREKNILKRNKYYSKAFYKLSCLSANLQSNDLGWLYN